MSDRQQSSPDSNRPSQTICCNCFGFFHFFRHLYQQRQTIHIPEEQAEESMFTAIDRVGIDQAKADILAIKTHLQGNPSLLRRLTRQVRHIIDKDEVANLFATADPAFIYDKLALCDAVLDIAYYEVDTGGDVRLANWVERGLQNVLYSTPNEAHALTSLGRAWLYKAQQYLSKIVAEEGSSGGSSGSFPFSLPDWTSVDEDRDTAEQDRRRQEGIYVDARTCLLPAVDFFEQAVAVRGSRASGRLLVLQAEANMSLGNVTVSTEAQAYFHTAVSALQRASLIRGFVLPPHLDRYLRSFEFVLYQ